MRFRALGSLITAAMVAISLISVSSAMATESTALCKINASPCNSGDQVKAIHFVAGVTTLKTNVMTILCLSSLMTAEAPSGLGHPLGLQVTALTWVNCGSNASHTNCTLKTVAAPKFDLLKISLNYATAAVLGLAVSFSCGEFFQCTYESGGASWEFKGAAFASGNGQLSTADWALAEREGFLCPESAKWTGSYEALAPVYIAA